MRKVVFALALASLGLVQPASAAPLVHTVRILSSTHANVTCDTSGYPATRYPCSFSAVMDGQYSCNETTSDRQFSNACVVTVTGTIFAVPSLAQTGRCTFEHFGQSVTLTFDSGVDPAFHVSHPNSTVIVQSVDVYYGNIGTSTQVKIDLMPPGALPSANALSMGFSFSDIQYDCRTRAGGDPTSDVAGAPNVHPAPIGSLTFIRT